MPGSGEGQTAGEATPPPHWRVGVDVGGTFTDLVALETNTGTLRVVKLPSTPPDFHRAVIEAVSRVADGGGSARVVHGSTVATNALLQRAGEPVAFVTTEGFRDMLLIGRQNRPNLYALRVERPRPLTPEENAFTVRERIDARGEVVEPLDEADVRRVVAEITGRGLKHVAVCLLFSFVNPAHEQRIAEHCRAAGLTVSLSSDVLPEFREYERASTTVINASLRPTVEAYLRLLAVGMGLPAGHNTAVSAGAAVPADGDRGLDAPPGEVNDHAAAAREGGGAGAGPDPRLDQWSSSRRRAGAAAGSSVLSLDIMHSGGGTLGVTDAAKSAARLVLSGPAGGVTGAAFVARAAGFEDVITYDMGGTSTDVATVIGGQPQWTTGSTVDGLPIGLAAFDIHTVGAGGGSVAHLDAGGALRVGPRSAGARPGPACYGRGGTDPTVTDANVVLGRVVPEDFAGGTIRIDVDLGRRAIGTLADRLGRSVVEAALGILRVAEDNMAHAVRAVTSRRGLDPRLFTLVSFGGAGGLHAAAVAGSLEIPRVLVPPYCGVLSALGMVAAPPVADASRTVVHLGDQLDDARIAAEYGAVSMLTMQHVSYEQTAVVEAWADVRFRGQSHEVKVRVTRPTRDDIAAAFRSAYTELYGRVPTGRRVEIVTLRVRRIGKVPELRLPTISPATARSDRRVRLVDAGATWRDAPALSRAQLLRTRGVDGPALLLDPEATAYVPPGWRAVAHEDGSVVLERMTR